MDAFAIRDRLVTDYADYVRSFITVRDARMREHVDEVLDGGTLWPEPLIQLNPAFEVGEPVADLIAEGVLHSKCDRIFRSKSAADSMVPVLHTVVPKVRTEIPGRLLNARPTYQGLEWEALGRRWRLPVPAPASSLRSVRVPPRGH